jgi:hypothetical protein
MQAIRDGTVVSAHFDSANHLILTKYDGTTVDAGALATATTTQAGSVELATNAETQSGSATNLAVTPAGLASLPGTRVQILTGTLPAESAAQSAYPTGISMMDVSGWSIGGGFGTVVTHNVSQWRCEQTFYKAVGGTSIPQNFMRHHNAADGGGGWTAWYQVLSNPILSSAGFTQLTAAASYPRGFSRLYYTTANGGSWDFNGLAGEVFTYSDGSSFARQTFVQHVAGSANKPVVWTRTSDWTTGWSSWSVHLNDPGAWTSWTPSWSTTSGIHLPAFGNATVNFKAYKLARKVDVQFDVAFGSTTNFGASATTTDNWTFGLPPAWPATASSFGTFLGIGDMYRNATNCGFTRIKLSGTTTISFGILATFVAGALGGGIGGDVDSVTPWAWASGDAIRGSFTYETAA